jgi:carnitine 3-dehydrogenase
MKITFVGAGMIGGGLAVNALLKGHEVALYHVTMPPRIKESVRHIMDILVKAEVTDKMKADLALQKAVFTNDIEVALSGTDFVQESVPERLELKKETYRKIQELTGDATIIASSTSAMFPSKLREGALFPEKIIVGHPYNPAYLLPLVEICAGNNGDPAVISRAKEVYTSIGKVPVVCRKEINGFVVNRLSWSAYESAKESVVQGVCSVEDMDKAIMFGPGLRMAVTGQLLTISLGIDGGYRNAAEKYGLAPDPLMFESLASGVDEEIANRNPDQGNTIEGVCEFRDRMFAKILKLHGLL